MIASKSPLATFSIKTLLNYTRDHSVSDSLEYAITWNAAMLQTPDMSAAALAKMAKRQATFPNLPDVRAKL
jgi:enoyl-CoA hydratase